jgi:hypothetical protein
MQDRTKTNWVNPKTSQDRSKANVIRPFNNKIEEKTEFKSPGSRNEAKANHVSLNPCEIEAKTNFS